MYVKAILPESRVATMMRLLQTQSPLQVYTVSLGVDYVSPQYDWRREESQMGTVYLFGLDRPGQLARITEILSRFGASVLHLRVQSGTADVEKCDFAETRRGGPLAELRVRIIF